MSREGTRGRMVSRAVRHIDMPAGAFGTYWPA
jgi:hypothetical protein